MKKITVLILSLLFTHVVGAAEPIYYADHSKVNATVPFHEEHLIKYSVCQDETKAECQEFVTDKYTAFKGLDAYLAHHETEVATDFSAVKDAFQASEPQLSVDHLVKNASHISDRRFAHIG